jgi:hypothetical protein
MVEFDYSSAETAGIRIFIEPFSNGVFTPNYGCSGSPIYTPGQGSIEAFFNILSGSGQVIVDQIRIYITNVDQSVLIDETFIPVNYTFQ